MDKEIATSRTQNEQQQRDSLLLDYLAAVERGDLEGQTHLLEEAGDDPLFAEMAWEAHLELASEMEQELAAIQSAQADADAATVRDLAISSLRSARGVAQTLVEAQRLQEQALVAGEDEEPLVPLMLSDVGVRLRADVADNLVPRGDRAEVLQVAETLEREAEHVIEPFYLTARGARSLMERLGLTEVASRLVKVVHETLLSMDMARQQETVRLAAARRQRKGSSPRPTQSNEDKEKFHPKADLRERDE